MLFVFYKYFQKFFYFSKNTSMIKKYKQSSLKEYIIKYLFNFFCCSFKNFCFFFEMKYLFELCIILYIILS